MEVCKRCGEEFEETDNERNPVTELGDMFSKGMTGFKADDLCAKCRKVLALTTLLGFDA